jgi:hypothetical protein
MAMTRNLTAIASLALATVAASAVHADVVVPLDPSGWVFHNQTGTVGGTLNSPTFTPTADNAVAVMARFSPVQLVNNGDFIEVSLILKLGTRSGDSLGAGGLNTGLRIGLFNGPSGAINANDTGNLGILAQYMNTGGLVQEQTNSAGTNPFQSPTLATIGSGGADVGGDSLRGATVGDAVFDLKLTLNAGKYDVTGQISGTDSSNGHAYSSTINLPGYTPSTLGFDFNRVGFFFGNKADGDSTQAVANFTSTLSNLSVMTNITAIPESSLGVLMIALAGAGTAGWRARFAGRRRNRATA